MSTTAVRPAMVLAAVALPLAVLSIDFTGVIVALPEMAADLGMAESDVGWVVNAFALGFAGPMLAVGKVSDDIGHRRVLLAGLVVFAVGSVTCALTPTSGLLIAGRAVQGVGSALFMTSSLALVSMVYEGDARRGAIGRWSAVGGTASAIGPLVGGGVTAALSWRWFFGVNLPLLAASAVLLLSAGRPDRSAGAAARSSSHGWRRWLPSDLAGALLSSASVVLLVMAMQEAADHPLTSPLLWATSLAGVAALVVFGRVEKHADDPVLPPGFLRRRAFAVPLGAATVANLGFGAFELLLTLYLQSERGWSALETGLAFLAYSVPFALIGAGMGRLGRRWRTQRLMMVGLVVVVGSFALLALLPALPLLAVVGALVVGGVGQGLVYNASSTDAMSAVDESQSGLASAVLGVGRNIGIAPGIAAASIATARADVFVDGVLVAAVALGAITAVATVVLRVYERRDRASEARRGAPA